MPAACVRPFSDRRLSLPLVIGQSTLSGRTSRAAGASFESNWKSGKSGGNLGTQYGFLRSVKFRVIVPLDNVSFFSQI